MESAEDRGGKGFPRPEKPFSKGAIDMLAHNLIRGGLPPSFSYLPDS